MSFGLQYNDWEWCKWQEQTCALELCTSWVVFFWEKMFLTKVIVWSKAWILNPSSLCFVSLLDKLHKLEVSFSIDIIQSYGTQAFHHYILYHYLACLQAMEVRVSKLSGFGVFKEHECERTWLATNFDGASSLYLEWIGWSKTWSNLWASYQMGLGYKLNEQNMTYNLWSTSFE